MPASRTERRVFLWKIFPRPIPFNAGKVVSLPEIISILERQRAELPNRARVYLSPGGMILDEVEHKNRIDPKQQIYVADIKRNARFNTVTFLINRGDPDAISPAFINSETSDVRVEHPKEKESPGWSAHLVISLGKDGRGGHKSCFEKMPRVSSSLVTAAINKILEQAVSSDSSYTFIYSQRKEGKIVHENRRYRPFIEVNKVPSDKLEKDLNDAVLTGVTLTKNRIFYNGVGAGNVVKKQKEKVVISTRPAEPASVKAFISGLMQRAKEEEYEDISFHIGDLPGDASKSATMSVEEVDAMEVLYARTKLINDFTCILEGCYDKVSSEIEAKLIEMLADANFSGK